MTPWAQERFASRASGGGSNPSRYLSAGLTRGFAARHLHQRNLMAARWCGVPRGPREVKVRRRLTHRDLKPENLQKKEAPR